MSNNNTNSGQNSSTSWPKTIHFIIDYQKNRRSAPSQAMDQAMMEICLESRGQGAMISDPQLLIRFDRQGNVQTREVILVTIPHPRDLERIKHLAQRIAQLLDLEDISLLQRCDLEEMPAFDDLLQTDFSPPDPPQEGSYYSRD